MNYLHETLDLKQTCGPLTALAACPTNPPIALPIGEHSVAVNLSFLNGSEQPSVEWLHW